MVDRDSRLRTLNLPDGSLRYGSLFTRLFLVFAPFLLSTGCSSSNEGAVTGVVTVDGLLAKEGAIDFIPVDGQSRTSGAKIVEGKYGARVPVGNMLVRIRVSKIVGQRRLYNTPDSPTQPIYEEVLPPKYNDQTELRLEVKPGINAPQDYKLSTK